MRRVPRANELVIAVASSIAIAISTFFPAAEARVGNDTKVLHLSDIWGVRYVIMAFSLGLGLVAAIEVLGRKRPAMLAAFGFGLLSVMLVPTATSVAS